jgi:hypothetical protein
LYGRFEIQYEIGGASFVDEKAVQKTRCKVFSRNQVDDGPYAGGGGLGEDAGAEKESLRGLLARPFYWLGLIAVVFLLIFLWSAEHVEGVSATDVD